MKLEYRICPSVACYSLRILISKEMWDNVRYSTAMNTLDHLQTSSSEWRTFIHPGKREDFVSWEEGFDIGNVKEFLKFLHRLGFQENPNLIV